MSQKNAVFNWSGGKDSALALYKTQQSKKFTIQQLITTVGATTQRISMHGVRKELLVEQANAIGLPLKTIELPESTDMDTYNHIMSSTNNDLKTENITHSIFGDIFLEDLKAYREQQLQKVGINAHFPLWGKDTKTLIHEFLDLGFKTIIVATKEALLGKDFIGKVITKELIESLPENVDPCGENGEFHTFVFDGPIFKKPVSFKLGEIIHKNYVLSSKKEDECFKEKPETNNMGFYFCDLIPTNN